MIMTNEEMASIWGVDVKTTEFSKRISAYLDAYNSGVFRGDKAAVVDHVKKLFDKLVGADCTEVALLTCPSCGQTGLGGQYPFSTCPPRCDDCV